MICFNCGYNLPSNEIKECPLCGMKFPSLCHTCHSPNPMMAKFCFNCGEEINKNYVQSSVKNYDVLAESRKNVAVVFADVSGFTALSEMMDPEEIREIINDTFHYITKPVYELEGTIDKYIGDCVMILFGAKHAHSDDPKRAVACGMEMIRLIKEFSEERLHDKGITLDLSVGINYGLVVTGSVGNYFDKDYTVMGDVVNTAQRLQTIAEKGSILVSGSVYSETKDLFEYSEEKEVVVKNKKNSIKAYSPLSIKLNSTIDHMTLIDREKEINFLHNIYLSANQIKPISIIGEAGIGKSSLVDHFVTSIQDVKKVWISCNQIYQNRVHYVISNILLDIMNIDINDNQRIKLNRLKSFIDYILKDKNYSDDEIKKSYDFIGLIIGLERDHEFTNILNAMNYQDLQREILKQLSIFFENTLSKSRYIFVIDDIQWADLSSIKILESLMRIFQNHRSMLIFTSRYESEELMSFQANREFIIQLNPLSKEGINDFASKLLQVEEVDTRLIDLINKFTNGNPLFIKEFITALKRKEHYYVKEGKAYLEKGEISLPNTIESLILGNISELDEFTRKFLQIASVVGKEFNLSWLSNLLQVKQDDIDISKLLNLNIISLIGIQTTTGNVDKVYVFNQDTIREVIYESILNKTKQELHKKIGDLIETKYFNELEVYYEVLSVHYNLAGVTQKTIDYYLKTAIKYKNDYKNLFALEYYSKYKELVEVKQINDSRYNNALIDMASINIYMANYDIALEILNKAYKGAKLVDDKNTINIHIANIYKETGKFIEALNVLEEIEPIIRQNSNIYGKLLQLKCSILRITGNSEALKLAERSEEILLKVKDYENLSETMSQAGILHFINGDIDNSVYYLNKGYQYAEKIKSLRLMARTSGNLGIIYHSSGMTSKALEFFSKSIEISDKISNLPSSIIGNINLAILYMEKGLLNKAEILFKDTFEKSSIISSVINQSAILTNMGDLKSEQGKYDEAMGNYNKSLDIARKHGLTVEEGINYLGIAKVNLKIGSNKSVLELLNKAKEIFEKTNEISYLSDYYRYISAYELFKNNLDPAVDYCNQAIHMAEQAKNDMKKLKALRLKGKIITKMGDYDHAIELYKDSINLALQLESDYEAAKGYFRKHELLDEVGDNKEAEESLLLAKEYINKTDQSVWTTFINNE